MKFFTFKFELFKPPFSVVCLWWRLIKVILFNNIEKHFSCSQTLKLWTTTSSWQTKQPRQCLGCTNYWWLVTCTWFLKHHWKFGLITLLPWDKIRNGAFQESRRNRINQPLESWKTLNLTWYPLASKNSARYEPS